MDAPTCYYCNDDNRPKYERRGIFDILGTPVCSACLKILEEEDDQLIQAGVDA